MLVLFIIIGSVFLRLLPHIPNVAPITAIALFGGTYLKKRYAFVIPFAAMVLSDYLLLYVSPFGTPMFQFHQIYPITSLFHSTTMYVWGSFMISGLLSLFLRKKRTPAKVIYITLFASIQFFLITNF